MTYIVPVTIFFFKLNSIRNFPLHTGMQSKNRSRNMMRMTDSYITHCCEIGCKVIKYSSNLQTFLYFFLISFH